MWESEESCSGPGSEYAATATIRDGIRDFIKTYKISTFIDAPCGDVNWIEPQNLAVKYIGCDIVEELIQSNTQKFSDPSITFRCLDITKDSLPEGDVILCRECLQHLSYEQINKFLENLRSSSVKYLLTTTHINEQNTDIIHGHYFPINLENRPFNFPKPLLLIEEKERNKVTGEKKYLGLWESSKFGISEPIYTF